jgi:hypothetical protein
MKKIYSMPQVKIYHIAGAVVMNSISNPNRTNITGLSVSDDDYEGDVYSKEDSFWD